MSDRFNETVSPNMKAMLGQLLIALVKRNGNYLKIPVAEVDDTGQDVLSMEVDIVNKTFIFRISKKS